MDTVGLLRASNEVQFKPKLYGGAFLGLLVTGIKQQLGPLIIPARLRSVSRSHARNNITETARLPGVRGFELENACARQIRAIYLKLLDNLPLARPKLAARDLSLGNPQSAELAIFIN